MPVFLQNFPNFFLKGKIGQRLFQKGLDTDLRHLEPIWDPFSWAIATHGYG